MKKIWMLFAPIMSSFFLSLPVQAVTVSWTTANHIGTEAGTTRLMTAKLSATTTEDVTVPFRIGPDSTATKDVDYTMETFPIEIPAGTLSVTRVITIIQDQDVEDHEYVTIHMGTPTNATQGAITNFHALILNED